MKERNSNLELLRIISMFMIVTFHFTIHGGWTLNKVFSFNELFIDFIGVGGKIGVVCFMLITGYFMIDSKYNPKKIVNILVQVLFYSWIIFILFLIFGNAPLNKEIITKSIFPIIFTNYWFITDYILIYIFSPFINKIVDKLKKTDLEKLLGIYFIIFIVVNTIFNTDLRNNQDHFIQLIFIYLIGAYIKKYKDNTVDAKTSKKYLCGFIICWIVIFLTAAVFIFVGQTKPDYLYKVFDFYVSNKLFVLLAGMYLFLYFKNLKPHYNKVINRIGGLTLGIYLFHDNFIARYYLWQVIFKVNKYYYSRSLFLIAIISIVGIFLIGLLIEWFRQWLFSTKYVNKGYKKIEELGVNILSTDISKLWNKFFNICFFERE